MPSIPGLGFLGRFFGNTVSSATGYAIGGAMQKPVEPLLRELENQTRRELRFYPLPTATAAELAAQKIWNASRADLEASYNGTDADAFLDLVKLADRAPTLAEALDLWRREDITEAEFEHAMDKAQIEPQYRAGLRELKIARLSVEEIANAVQQGFLPDDGLLPPAAGGTPPFDIPTEQVPLSPLREALDHGVNTERLRVLAELSGNPPGPMELLEMWRRGIIGEASVDKGIREGRTKTKWTPAIKALKQAVLSAADYAGLHLRGWIDVPTMNAGGALTGHTPEQMDLLFKNRGRPATAHQVFIGLRRGGSLDGPLAGIPAAFVEAIKQSDIRPEWTNLLWAQRYVYPSAFVLRALTQAGDLTQAETETILLDVGWEPILAKTVSTKWAGTSAAGGKQLTKAELSAEYEGGFISAAEFRSALGLLGYKGASVDLELALGDARRVKAQRDAVINAGRAAYVKHAISRAEAGAELDALGVGAAARDSILATWDVELRMERKQLTDARVASAYRRGLLDQTTALAELTDRGYADADARVLLGLTAAQLTDTEIRRAFTAGAITEAQALAQLEAKGLTPEQAAEVLA